LPSPESVGHDPGPRTNPPDGRTGEAPPTTTLEMEDRDVPRSPSGLELAQGVLLGRRYHLEGLPRRGAGGRVQRGGDQGLGKEGALKFIHGSLLEGRERFERLRDEVLLAHEVSHKNVCRTYDLEEIEGRWVVKMEYIDGETLDRRLSRGGRLPIDAAVDIAR